MENVWKVLSEGIKVYFKHIGNFTKYMLFPVFGQILGLYLVFAFLELFMKAFPFLSEKFPVVNNLTLFVILILLISLPGLAVFLKAFWDYLVAYGALNSMAQAVLKSGKLYDLKAHTQVITKHSFKFALLVILIGILSAVAINPLFWILGLIFFIYFILVFQVFTFEEEISVTDCFKRSLTLVKGNFALTFSIAVLLFIICYWALDCVLYKIVDFVKLGDFLRGVFESRAMKLPLDEVNSTLVYFKLSSITALDISNRILSSVILFITAGLTLPLRSICWTLWYQKRVNNVCL